MTEKRQTSQGYIIRILQHFATKLRNITNFVMLFQFWYYIKQIMNVFIRAMVRIFSFGERWNVPINSAVASLNRTFHLSPHENILTIALINIHSHPSKCFSYGNRSLF